MTQPRRVMNIRNLQVFEAVARHRSLTSAARELGITQSAVSHQVRALADRRGEALIERRGRHVALTDAGERLARSLVSAFDIIEREAAAQADDRTIVRLGVYSSFAGPWFLTELARFLDENPTVDLRTVMLYDPHEISPRVADIFVTSERAPSGYWSQRLWRERLVPVVHASLADASFETGLPLISAEVEPGIAGRAWEAFAELNGLDMHIIRHGDWLCCSHYIFALEMVRAGMGAALLPDFMVAPFVERGVLRRLPGTALPTGQTYDLQVPFARRQEAAIRLALNWLSSRLGALDEQR